MSNLRWIVITHHQCTCHIPVFAYFHPTPNSFSVSPYNLENSIKITQKGAWSSVSNLSEMATRKTFWWATSVKPVVVIGHLIVPQLHYVLVIDITGKVFARCLAVYVLSIVIVVGVVLQRAGGEAVEIVLSKPLQCQVILLWKSTEKQRGRSTIPLGGNIEKRSRAPYSTVKHSVYSQCI